MNRLTLNIITGLLLLAAIHSCKKNDLNDGLEPQRLFKPQGISIKTTATTATVTWNAPILSKGQPLSYTAEVSQDSTFATAEFTFTTDTSSLVLTEEKLTLRKKYFVRIKANAYENQPESKWERSSAFGINGEQWFYLI